MGSLGCQVFFQPIRCSSTRDDDPHKQKLNSIKINGTSTIPTNKVEELNSIKINGTSTMSTNKVEELNSIKINGTQKVDGLSQSINIGTTVAAAAENGYDTTKEQSRQNIPTDKQLVDPFRQGKIIDGGVGYRQTIVVRSYEVGADKTATIESILNLLQETALNHVWMSGLLGDGFGATHGMMKNNLIWVVTRMQVQIDSYPIWGEIVEIDTWVGASGKNGMRRDWLIQSHNTGHVFARGTSTWVMMNEQTRRLSKMPEEVRAEISPWFINKQAIRDDGSEKIKKLDNKAKYVNSNLKPKRSDLDMNHHVNNVKYVRWMLENIPDEIVESHQLSGMTLEYRRECGPLDEVQSLCEPDEDGAQGGDIKILNGFPLASEILDAHRFLGALDMQPLRYTHLLQTGGESKNEEIVRGRTTWKRKLSTMPFSI